MRPPARGRPKTADAEVSWIHCGSCLRRTIDRRSRFSSVALQDVCECPVDRQELLYNASVLAHYAQVSTRPTSDLPAPASLRAVFDHFVVDTTLLHDSPMMETAGAQCLLLAGFFEDQMRRRHNIRWYAELGAISSAGRPLLDAPSQRHGCSIRSPGASNRGASATRD